MTSHCLDVLALNDVIDPIFRSTLSTHMIMNVSFVRELISHDSERKQHSFDQLLSSSSSSFFLCLRMLRVSRDNTSVSTIRRNAGVVLDMLPFLKYQRGMLSIEGKE